MNVTTLNERSSMLQRLLSQMIRLEIYPSQSRHISIIIKNRNRLDILAMPPLHLSRSQNSLTGFVDNLQKILFGKFLTHLDTSQ